jgi:hypothetical protein
MRFFKLAGYLSLFFGTLSVLFTVQIHFLFFGLITSILGFIASITYIFIKTRNEIKTGFFNQGIVGMLLSSVPVLVLLVIIFSSK